MASEIREQVKRYLLIHFLLTLIVLPPLTFFLITNFYQKGEAQAIPKTAYTVPSSIAADCSVDVRSQLQTWIDQIPDNSLLIFPQGSCYRIDDNLVVVDRRDLEFEGTGAKIMNGAQNGRPLVVFYGGGNHVFSGFEMTGQNPNGGKYNEDLAFGQAIRLRGVDGMTIQNIYAHDLFGDFIRVGGDNIRRGDLGQATMQWSKNVVIKDSRFERSGRQGIAFAGVQNVTVSGNYLAGAARSLFDLEPPVNSVVNEIHDVFIINNTTGSVNNHWLSSAGAGASITNIQIIGNKMVDTVMSPLFVVVHPGSELGKRRGPFIIKDNNFLIRENPTENAGFARFNGVTDSEISGNFAPSPRRPAIELIYSEKINITNNDFSGATVLVVSQDSTYTESNNKIGGTVPPAGPTPTQQPQPTAQPTSGPISQTPNSIGYIGCSNTASAVSGYHQVAGNLNLFWPEYSTGGQTVFDWANPQSNRWTAFDRNVKRFGQPKAVWVQLCENELEAQATYATIKQVLVNTRSHAPSATLYISPLNSYDPKTLCGRVGPDGVDDVIAFANQAVSEGFGLRGPDLGPLNDQQTTDNCHPTDATKVNVLGVQLVNFFD